MDSLLHSIVLSPENGVGEHERRVARDLETLNLPAANWPAHILTPDGETVTDVLVVGAGMNGIAAAAALIFKGVRNVRILERCVCRAMKGPGSPSHAWTLCDRRRRCRVQRSASLR